MNEKIAKIGTTRREILLLGDLNERIGKKGNDNVVGWCGKELVNDKNGRSIIYMSEQNQLTGEALGQ